jgi:hypothetical protein
VNIIKSNPPGGGVKATPSGVRVANVGQEQGGEGDKPRTRRGDLVEPVAMVKRLKVCQKRRQGEPANAGYLSGRPKRELVSGHSVKRKFGNHLKGTRRKVPT